MSWTRDQISVLLDEYEARPVLYDAKHEYYHNKMSRTCALREIVDKIIKIRPNTTIDMIKSKLNTLRTQFNKEINHLKTKLNSTDINGHNVSLWCFKRMMFLKDHVLVKKYNISITVPEQQQQLEPMKKEHSQESWVEFSDNLESQYEQENSGHQEEELLSPTSSNGSDTSKTDRKRKRSETNDDITDIPTIFSTKETEEKWDVFSKFVTSEIRTIKSERRKKIIKRGIISLIFKHQEEEENEMN